MFSVFLLYVVADFVICDLCSYDYTRTAVTVLPPCKMYQLELSTCFLTVLAAVPCQ
jgi:hypothetical protein